MLFLRHSVDNIDRSFLYGFYLICLAIRE